MSSFQIITLEDVDDWLGDYPGEMRGITYAIGLLIKAGGA